MNRTYGMAGMATLVLGLALASSPANSGPPPTGGAFATHSAIDATAVVKQAVVVVRRGAVARRPVARCA